MLKISIIIFAVLFVITIVLAVNKITRTARAALLLTMLSFWLVPLSLWVPHIHFPGPTARAAVEKPNVGHYFIVNKIKDFDSVAYNKRDAYYEKEIEKYKQAIQTSPDSNAEIYFKLADAYYEKDDYIEAIHYYEEAAKKYKNPAPAYCNMGESYYEIGAYERAIDYFNKAIDAMPGYRTSYYGMGNVYYKKGEYANAIDYYKKAIEKDSTYALPYAGIGNAYKAQGKNDKANEWYQKAVNRYHETLKKPDAGVFYYLCMGITYQELGGEQNKTKADDCFLMASIILRNNY